MLPRGTHLVSWIITYRTTRKLQPLDLRTLITAQTCILEKARCIDTKIENVLDASLGIYCELGAVRSKA